MKRRPQLSPIENKILRVLVGRVSYLTTQEIADRAGISWNTALKYLKKFNRKKWITKKKVGNTRIYWKAIIKKK